MSGDLAADLLGHAGRMVEEAETATVSAWSRAAALLARQSVEVQLAEFWKRRLLGAVQLNMRAQLNCARVYIDPETAGRLSYVWYALSRATHHHPYELDPTAEELRSLIRAADEVNERVRSRCGTTPVGASATGSG